MLTINNTMESYLKNVEIKGNTIQNPTNLADIKSVGKKLDNQELYEIPLLSCGKNLFGGKLEYGHIVDGKPTAHEKIIRVVDSIEIKPNTKYCISVHESLAIERVALFKNGVFTRQVIPGEINKYTFSTLEENEVKFVIKNKGNWDKVDFNTANSNLQLEEGTTATQYEPYQSNKLTILSPVQLEKVGDMADRIIQKDGVWGVEKNIITTVLNHELKWGTYVGSSENNKIYGIDGILKNVKSDVCISDKYLSKKEIYTTGEEGMLIALDGRVRIGVSSSKEYSKTIESFKKELEVRPLSVKYPISNPQFIPLPQDQQVLLKTFDNKTNISFLTEVEGTIKAQVPKSMKATVNTHTSQIENIYDELDRVKKLEESTVSTVTTDKDFANVQATTNGYFEDVKLQGKTLVNMTTVTNKKIKTNSLNANERWLQFNTPFGFKANKTYKIRVEIKNYTGTARIKCRQIGMDDSYEFNLNTIIPENPNGVYEFDFITTKDYKDFAFYFDGDMDNITSADLIGVVCVVKEDYNYVNVPFEGLKSVGDGVDEIVVSSVDGDGNLFDNDTNAYVQTNIIANVGSKLDLSNTNLARIILKSNIKVDPLKTYFLNPNDLYDYGVICTDDNDIVVYNSSWASAVEFKLPQPSRKLFIYAKRKDGQNIDKQSFANEKHIFSTVKHDSYIPHKADKKRILYLDPTDGTWKKPTLREGDTIEKHSDGKYYYHQRSREYVLNGGESGLVEYAPKDGTNINTVCFEINISDAKVVDKVETLSKHICDKFTTISQYELYNFEKEGCSITTTPHLRIRINKSKLETPDLAGFKKWLQANNVTVVYQLAQEKVFECTNLDLITYQNETNYVFSGGVISPRTSLKVQNNIGNVISTIQKKVSLMENYVTSMFRAVLAGDMRAVAQTLYPNDFTHESVPMEEIK